jgi:hypothetical protein
MAIAAFATVLPNQKKTVFAKSPDSLTHPVLRLVLNGTNPSNLLKEGNRAEYKELGWNFNS